MPRTRIDAAKKQKHQHRYSPEKPNVKTHEPPGGAIAVNLSNGHVNPHNQTEPHGADNDA
jgi:hypothetical protein